MKMFYDEKRDYAEILVKEGSKVKVELNEFVSEFRSEFDEDEVLGYGFKNASRSLKDFPNLTDAVKKEILKGGKNDTAN